MDRPADLPSSNGSARPVERASRRAAIGMLLAYIGMSCLAVALTLALSGLAVMGTDPCFPGSPCVAAYERWVRAIWVTIGLVVTVCGFGVVRARSFKGKLAAVLCLPLATLLVWALFLANSDFSDAGVVLL
jgi:hypothetical protein